MMVDGVSRQLKLLGAEKNAGPTDTPVNLRHPPSMLRIPCFCILRGL